MTNHRRGLTDHLARERDDPSRLPHHRQREPRDSARLPDHGARLTGLSASEPGHPASERGDLPRDACHLESERGECSGGLGFAGSQASGTVCAGIVFSEAALSGITRRSWSLGASGNNEFCLQDKA
uniref:Uncharacterized protein n=1 Tax=Candidatus Kentrum sp. LPFa TaxID=2126335 RepID=A0A450WT00_9GAMM|nr:MAG: hypothetical protein BECKLPF1236A_GA0070988_102512 [Candidatus Kentron sp. LPFa]VFK30619.1 MAG: hypothetical protein BECKLPF1236C_GA0070990_101162 [Candidatus Kentron sp. LPFa]